MAERELLEGLSDKEIEALEKALSKRKRSKIDWDNMTDAERAAVNRTTQPVTPTVPYYEFPKMLYGNVNGTVQAAEIASEKEEQQLKAKYPDAGWTMRMADFGLETCPSKPSGPTAKAFIPVGAAQFNPAVEVSTRVDENPPPPRPLTYEQQLHPLARKKKESAWTPERREKMSQMMKDRHKAKQAA